MRRENQRGVGAMTDRIDALRALLMVENIDTIADLCRKHKVKEPSFRAIIRALIAQEGGE